MTLEEEMMDVLYEISSIKSQIEAAKATHKQTGQYADPVWFAKANAALRYKQARHQELLKMKSDKTKEEKKSRAREFERAFVDVARDILEPDLFAEIMDEVHLICNPDGGKE